MNNIKYFYLTFILLSVNLFGQNDSISETENRPNIVFIMSDDHAVSAVSAYNDWLAKIAPTPNIDRIAENGMLMNRVFNTNSICGPSRASILTGKYSHVNGFFKNEKEVILMVHKLHFQKYYKDLVMRQRLLESGI